MLLRTDSHRYRGWKLRWLSDGTESEIADFDPVALTFTLKEPRKMSDGDEFYIYSNVSLPWFIHHNLIDNCNNPISIESFAKDRAIISDNVYHERKTQE